MTLGCSRRGWCQRNQLINVETQSLSRPTYEEKGVGDWVQSVIYSIAPCHQKAGFRHLPSWWALGGLGEWHPQRSWKSHALFLAFCSSASPPPGWSWNMSFIINPMICASRGFSKFCEPLQQVNWTWGRRPVEPPTYSWWVRGTSDNSDLRGMSEGGQGQSYRTHPLTCGIWCHLHIGSVRTELNCRHPAGVWEWLSFYSPVGSTPCIRCIVHIKLKTPHGGIWNRSNLVINKIGMPDPVLDELHSGYEARQNCHVKDYLFLIFVLLNTRQGAPNGIT